jgi:catechol 2,3-dioxygenase-like lactoylglutathione lyase family enzyme
MTADIGMVAPLEIGLCVPSLEHSLAFYRDVLGFVVVSSIHTPEETAVGSGFAESGYTVIRLQLPTGERLKLFQPDEPPARHGRSARPLAGAGFAYLTLIVADIRAVLDRVADHGFPARVPAPFTLRDNVLVALVDDPDGNVIELVQYIDLGLYRPELLGVPHPQA